MHVVLNCVLTEYNCLKIAATVCNRAETGLSLLRENKNGYDIVLSDVHMPDMDGFKLLEHIGLEMDLPVISKFTNSFGNFFVFIEF